METATPKEIVVRDWTPCEVCDDTGSVVYRQTLRGGYYQPDEWEPRPATFEDDNSEPCPNEEHPYCFGCGDRLYVSALVCDDWPRGGRAVGICLTALCARDAITNLDDRADGDGPSAEAVAELVAAYYWRKGGAR